MTDDERGAAIFWTTIGTVLGLGLGMLAARRQLTTKGAVARVVEQETGAVVVIGPTGSEKRNVKPGDAGKAMSALGLSDGAPVIIQGAPGATIDAVFQALATEGFAPCFTALA